jgi:hypothetical protein
MANGNGIKKQPLTLYWCNKCQNLRRTYYGSKECEIRYGKKDPPETVYVDEDGNYRCRHYKGRYY